MTAPSFGIEPLEDPLPAVAAVAAATRSLVVVGAGNIGSQLLPLVGRIPSVGRIVIIDRDFVELRNLEAQAFAPEDAGDAKALVHARALRRIRPALAVEALVQPLETVARGAFRADLILACLDSREARRVLGEIAWRLGVPLLDAGVHGAGLLARANAYDPHAAGGPCLQCAWGDADYRALAQTYPCAGAGEHRASQAPRTNAPAALGALAAALQALECEKWLAGRSDRLSSGHEVMVDAASHAHYRSTLRRSASCRFDHATWPITRLDDGPETLTLAAALALPGCPAGASLAVEGQLFVTDLSCAACGPDAVRRVPHLLASLAPGERRCARCGRERIPTGFDLTERLDAAQLDDAALRMPLRALGLRPREVFSVAHAGGAAHYELAAGHQGKGGA